VTAPDPLPGMDELPIELAALDDPDDCCECDDCLALAQEAAGRPMVTLQPRGEFL
jgi:hypothetical protein